MHNNHTLTNGRVYGLFSTLLLLLLLLLQIDFISSVPLFFSLSLSWSLQHFSIVCFLYAEMRGSYYAHFSLHITANVHEYRTLQTFQTASHIEPHPTGCMNGIEKLIQLFPSQFIRYFFFSQFFGIFHSDFWKLIFFFVRSYVAFIFPSSPVYYFYSSPYSLVYYFFFSLSFSFVCSIVRLCCVVQHCSHWPHHFFISIQRGLLKIADVYT